MTGNANVEVVRNSGENATNLIRRFTRRLQGAGVLPRVRGNRYYTRDLSKFGRKKRTLSILARKAKFEELSLLGKAPVAPTKKR
jgi:ribosomal protein S21